MQNQLNDFHMSEVYFSNNAFIVNQFFYYRYLQLIRYVNSFFGIKNFSVFITTLFSFEINFDFCNRASLYLLGLSGI